MKPTAVAVVLLALAGLCCPAAHSANRGGKASPVSVKKQSKVSRKAATRPPRAAKSTQEPDASAHIQQKRGLQKQQQELQQQIGKIQKDISLKQAQKQQETSAAQSAQRALDQSNRKLERLSAEKEKNHLRLTDIRKQSGQVSSKLAQTQKTIQANARLRYLCASRQPWGQLIAGTSPASLNQSGAILAYLAGSHQKKADNLENTKDRLKNQELQTARKERKLTADTATEKASNQQLAAGQELHESNAHKLEAQIEEHKQRIAELKKDQKRLSALIAQINEAIAAQERARQERIRKQRLEQKRLAEERRRQQREAARKGRHLPPPKAPEPAAEDIPDVAYRGQFARHRGALPMPVSGRISHRFGQSRNGAGTWQGIMISAAEGSPVRAVAAGMVVFSGTLRGFGKLIILDHGDGYLTVYAYNSNLLKSNGTQVSAGETIATVGSGGAEAEPGLYFEIRYKGRPVNPGSWLR